MKAFWWFKQDSIAGMARPGFNSVPWFDLPSEALLKRQNPKFILTGPQGEFVRSMRTRAQA